MCGECERGPLTYATIYNELYATNDREKSIRNMLRAINGKCLLRRERVLRHLAVALGQGICEKFRDGPVSRLIAKERQKEERVRHMRILRLQRQLLRYSYRPSGRNFYRSMLEWYA
eukprot:6634752-Prymnesium_polylepis.1